jgi:RNA polymerase sporulation-specific sigma factor
MTKREKQLWAAYRQSRTVENRNALVEHYYPKIKGIIIACCPRTVGLPCTDDDVGAASVGLVKSIESYKVKRGASFITYLRGAVRLEVLHERARGPQIGQTGKLRRGQSCSTVPLDGLDFAREPEPPEIERLEDIQQMTAAVLRSKRHVDTIIATFKPQERRVLKLMHFEGMSSKECARAMRLSLGRVSQIRKAALAKLRRALEV